MENRKTPREADHVLAEEAELLQSLNAAVEHGNLTAEEADEAIIAYRQTRYGDVVE